MDSVSASYALCMHGVRVNANPLRESRGPLLAVAIGTSPPGLISASLEMDPLPQPPLVCARWPALDVIVYLGRASDPGAGASAVT